MIADASVRNKGAVEDSLTLSILDYIRQAKYFTEAIVLPGKTTKNELILRFRFHRYRLERSMHPTYLPGALLTATLYIWFGGPIYKDRALLSGRLAVQDGLGSPIATVDSHVDEAHSVGFWSPQYALPSGIEARTAIVRKLLDKARAAVLTKGGGTP